MGSGSPGTRAGLRAGLLAAVLAAAAGCGRGAPEARTHAVSIRAFRYLPERVEVAAGDTVAWINEDPVPHTATTDGAWDSGNIAAGDTVRVVVPRAGRYAYRCAFHPNMAAELTAR
ncbi:MAG TPA: cupredoxin domain-containing protein [Longimicrobiaceae bacterium]|nr:cupredoxin domain-containing protein [Longimicrobiaceae bacterium]